MTTDSSIGQFLRDQRARWECSQQAVAQEMRDRGFDWAQATVSSVENGKRPLRLTEAIALAEFLDIELADFDDPRSNELLRAKRKLDLATEELERARTAWELLL